MAPLLWSAAEIDGEPMQKWIAEQDDNWKQEWPADMANGARTLEESVKAGLTGASIQLADAADPKGAKFTIKPQVISLQTGGWRPTLLDLSVQLVDDSGAVVEEIETQVKIKGRYRGFESRLSDAASQAGENIARWLRRQHEG